MIRKVILVFKTHFDIGFTDLADNVMHWYATEMLDSALATCRATSGWGDLAYVWTLPAWPLKFILRHCTPERRNELEHFIRSGQIAWHALPFTSHTDFCGEEEYLESLRCAKELSDTYGRPYPRTAKMTDVPGHGLMLPEVLAAGGVKFLHLGCNAFAMPPDVPELFWWEAPSGRKVLTMYHKGGYGSGIEAPADWPFPVWMALMPTMDNSGPDRPERIRELAGKAQRLYPGAQVVCGTMDDFLAELEHCSLSGIPTVRKDLADTWIHGVQSYPEEVRQVRQLRREAREINLALAAEDPACLRGFARQEKAYCENMLLSGEHTWGADVKTWLDPAGRVYEREAFKAARASDPHYAFMEKSWDEKRRYVRNAARALEAVRERAGLMAQSAPKKCAMPEGSPAQKECSAPEENPELVIRETGGILTASCGGWALDFDRKRGYVTRVCTENGAGVLDAREGRPVFDCQYVRYGISRMTEYLRRYAYRFSGWGIADNGRTDYPECETITFHTCYTSAEVHGRDLVLKGSFTGSESFEAFGNAETVRLTLHFPERTGGSLLVTLRLTNKQATPFIESGSFLMPLAKDCARFLVNKNGVMLDPAADIARNANHCFYALENGIAAKRSGTQSLPASGTSWILAAAPDTPLVSIGEDAVYDFCSEYEPSDPTLYFNLFNNMWGTNFPQWTEGNFEYRFALRMEHVPADRPEETKDLSGQLYSRLCDMADRICGAAPEEQIRALEKSGRLPDFGPDMQLLGIHPQGSGYRIAVRNLSARRGCQTASWPGFSLRECDYFGRSRGAGEKAAGQAVTFEKLPYGLYVFYAEKEC